MGGETMDQDLVTIVTVTYNAENHLEETILSVINQDYPNIEYIILDGGSTDGTIDIIKKYEKNLAYWISEPDKGIYFAMNKAIKKATGKWINFMNAGDTFFNNSTIQKVMDNLDKDTDLIYGDHVCDGIVGSVSDRSITRLMPCCHQSLFVKTDLMKQYPYNTFYSISADYEFLLKMYTLEKRFQYIEEPIANYLRNGFSDQNQIRWYLENLTLMMNNHINLEEITQSPAYNLIENKKFTNLQQKYSNLEQKYSSLEQKYLNLEHKYLILEKKYNTDTAISQKKLTLVYKLISDLFSIKFYKNPLEKLKALRRVYLFYNASLK